MTTANRWMAVKVDEVSRSQLQSFRKAASQHANTNCTLQRKKVLRALMWPGPTKHAGPRYYVSPCLPPLISIVLKKAFDEAVLFLFASLVLVQYLSRMRDQEMSVHKRA